MICIVTVQNRIGQRITVCISRIKLEHKGLVLQDAQVAIALENRCSVFTHIKNADIKIKDIRGVAIAHQYCEFVNIVRIIVIWILEVPG